MIQPTALAPDASGCRGVGAATGPGNLAQRSERGGVRGGSAVEIDLNAGAGGDEAELIGARSSGRPDEVVHEGVGEVVVAAILDAIGVQRGAIGRAGEDAAGITGEG